MSDTSSSVRDPTRSDERKRSSDAERRLISSAPSASKSMEHAMEERLMDRLAGVVQGKRLKAIRHQRDISYFPYKGLDLKALHRIPHQ